MEDYRMKIERLPTEKLQSLAVLYRATIKRLKARLNDALIVSQVMPMLSVVEYNQMELEKKERDLAEVEKLLDLRSE